jgi:hypothetical protein
MLAGGWGLRLAVALALLATAWVAAWPVTPPRVVPASAPRAAFSAERAMGALRAIAREPHVAGSPAQGQVRVYLLARIAALGLRGEVQRAGHVANVIARLPGSHPTRDLLIAGHYDARSPSPGAGDAGATVAAMLETLRALRAAPPLRNDVVFLFTDGEETGWRGATAFIEQHPAAPKIGVVLAFDSLPSAGMITLQQTSHGDGWLLRQLAAAKPPIWASSTTNEIERGVYDSDFDVFAAAGLPGMEFENEGKGMSYHTARDTVDGLDPRLVQGQGEVMLRLARHFGALDLRAAHAEADLGYVVLPWLGLLVYPPWLTPALAVLAACALAALLATTWRRRRLSLTRATAGALGLLAAVACCLPDAWAWPWLLAADPEGCGIWLATMLVGTGVGFAALIFTLSRSFGVAPLAAAGPLVYLAAWCASACVYKTGNLLAAPFVVWPFLGGVASLGVAALVRRPAWAAALLVLAALPGIVLTEPALVTEALRPERDDWTLAPAIGLLLAQMAPQLAVAIGGQVDIQL